MRKLKELLITEENNYTVIKKMGGLSYASMRVNTHATHLAFERENKH